MRLVVRNPPRVLAPFVASFWYFEGELPHARERILPSGSMQLLVNLHEDELRTYGGQDAATLRRTRGAVLSGAFARHFGIDTAEQRRIVGVRFEPGGAFPFFAAPPSTVSGAQVELDVLWGRDGATLRERLLEANAPGDVLGRLQEVLLAHAVRPLARDRAVAFALTRLDSGARVGEVIERVGMSSRCFIERFAAQVGLTPKRYARVRRFHHVLASLEPCRTGVGAQLAAACGYADQAHLIHDFREFSGMTPTAYRPRGADERLHVPLSVPTA
jgi:AraC-like DNA-binding protein